MGDETGRQVTHDVDERIRKAYRAGFAAAARGEEAAPGRTTSAEGRAFLRGYIEAAQARAAAADDV